MKWLVCLCHFCEQHGPNVLACSEYSLLSDGASNNEAKPNDDSRQSRCSACCPFDIEEPSYESTLTTRNGEKIVVSTSPEISNAEQYTIMRHACVRALIREVTPGQEGAVLFTMEEEGAEEKTGRTTYVLSYSFTLQDKYARGFRRSYVILVCCMHTDSDVASKQTAEEDASPEGNEQESAGVSETMAMQGAAANEHVLALVPLLIRRLYVFVQQVKAKCDAVFERDQQAGSGRALRLQNPSWQVNLVRSVCTLLDDVYAMRTFHAFFAELLLLVAGEGRLELESLGVESSVQRDARMHFADIRQVYQAFRRRLGAERAAEDFSELLYHALIGNQLICVCESDTQAAQSFLLALVEHVLPDECAQLKTSDSSYVEAFACNLLALRNVNALPTEVSDDASLYCVVLLSPEPDGFGATLLRRGASADAERERRRRVAAVAEVARVLTLVQSDLEVQLVQDALMDIRAELLNKARVFYACFKLGMFTDACASASAADEHACVTNQRNRLIEILNASGGAGNSRNLDARSGFDAQQVIFMFFARAVASEFTSRQKALASASAAHNHSPAKRTHT